MAVSTDGFVLPPPAVLSLAESCLIKNFDRQSSRAAVCVAFQHSATSRASARQRQSHDPTGRMDYRCL